MDSDAIRELLEGVLAGRLSVDEVLASLSSLPFQDLGFAKVDHHRALRTGFCEVIYGPGKTPDEIVRIARELRQGHECVLATRVDQAQRQALFKAFDDAQAHERARTVVVGQPKPRPGATHIPILTAGTSDLGVAEEALVTLRALGGKGGIIADVGVSGIHRLLAQVDELQRVRVLIVVAGMEGALASAVGGMVGCPVIAVPTSVGYGSHFGGVAALLSMLNSCAANVTVVGIDSGFRAAFVASCIDRITG